MNTSIFIQRFLNILKDYTSDHIINLGFTTITLNDIDKTFYGNWAFVDKKINIKNLSEIEKILNQNNRQSTIYFEDSIKLQKLNEFLNKSGYKSKGQDSFMFYEKPEIEKLNFSKVKLVKTQRDLKVFLNTANQCYFKNDPQGPYGELGDFLKIAEKAWYKLSKKGQIELYLAYKNHIPVATSILSIGNNIGYISLVGSLENVRGQGFGKLITLFSVRRSIELGNEYHCLATEEGNYPNEFYKRIGFKTKFKMNYYSK